MTYGDRSYIPLNKRTGGLPPAPDLSTLDAEPHKQNFDSAAALTDMRFGLLGKEVLDLLNEDPLGLIIGYRGKIKE